MNPAYHRRILDAVGGRLNARYKQFRDSNPDFNGRVG
jgi:hypothetical protein